MFPFKYEASPEPLPMPEAQSRARVETLLGLLLVLGITIAAWIALGPVWLWEALRASLYGFGHALPWIGARLFPLSQAPPWPATTAAAHPAAAPAAATGATWLVRALAVLRVVVLGAVLLGLAILASRLVARRRRAATQLWYEVELFQNDAAQPDQVRALYNAVWNALIPRSRWLGAFFLYRWFVGADALTLALVRDHDADGGEYLHLLLGAPASVLGRVLQLFQNVYQNVRFQPWRHPVPAAWPQMLRWGVRSRTPLHLLTLTSNYDAMPMEALIQAMSREAWKGDAPDDFLMSWTLMPVPSTGAERAVARAALYADWERSTAEQGAARSANTQLGHGLFQVDWRAGVTRFDQAQRLVGVMGIHNNRATLMPHNILIWRRPIARWIGEGLPTVFPLARGPRLWSGEAATFCALPTGRLRVAELKRHNVRRMPASRALSRDPATVLVEAEGHDRVGLFWEDLVKNLLLLGIQGSGKSTHLLNLFANAIALRDPDGRPAAPVILFDIGKDTAASALRLVPPDRTVLYVAPADDLNPWGLPLISGAPSTLAQVNHVIEVLSDVFGADAIGPRSKQALQHLIATIIAAATPEEPPSLDQAYKMMVDDEVRRVMIERAQLSGRLDDHTKTYWTTEFPHALETNPQFWEEAMAAPRNKLHEFLRSRQLRAVLGAADAQGYMKRAVDWDRVVRERQVVILDLSMKDLGAATVRLFGIVATLNLWHAIERQGALREEERVPVYTVYDEAQQYLSPSFLSILALGRSYGWRTALATRFLDELDEEIRDGVEDLCQNRIIHRIPLEPEAKRLMLNMMTVYINNITLQEEAQALERFMADDIMRLNDRQAICYWQAHGALQPPFIAYTLDWRPRAHEEWAAHHLSRQPAAPTLTLAPLPDPADAPAAIRDAGTAAPEADRPPASWAEEPAAPDTPAASLASPMAAADSPQSASASAGPVHGLPGQLDLWSLTPTVIPDGHPALEWDGDADPAATPAVSSQDTLPPPDAAAPESGRARDPGPLPAVAGPPLPIPPVPAEPSLPAPTPPTPAGPPPTESAPDPPRVEPLHPQSGETPLDPTSFESVAAYFHQFPRQLQDLCAAYGLGPADAARILAAGQADGTLPPLRSAFRTWFVQRVKDETPADRAAR